LEDRVGRFKEDHRHADSFGWYRSWQDDVSPGSSQRSGQGAIAEEVYPEAAQGHDVKLIPAQFVKSNKNDFLDAEAIAEAGTGRTGASFD
jgi:hypothetical protein